MVSHLSLNKSINEPYLKPILRWAGGKTWLIKHLINIKKSSFNNYHEPFFGGGAIFFYLKPKSLSYLSDLNKDLIETYITIRDDVDSVISKLDTFVNSELEYYRIRNENFESCAERAAKFIYLNQTSFNGIYRVNLKGIYNVPYGFRKKAFLDSEGLRNASLALKNTQLFVSDFYETLDNIKPKDLIFLDPPYTVSHNDNGFIKYNEKIFSLEDQLRLSQMISHIRDKDAYYVLTNAAHFRIEEIFEKGDKKIKLNRANSIGGHNSERGQTSEFIFTNTIL